MTSINSALQVDLFAQANAGLKFTPSSNSLTAGSFTVQASTDDDDAGRQLLQDQPVGLQHVVLLAGVCHAQQTSPCVLQPTVELVLEWLSIIAALSTLTSSSRISTL